MNYKKPEGPIDNSRGRWGTDTYILQLKLIPPGDLALAAVSLS